MKLLYPTVLFDWDGTLADTLTIWMNAYRKCFIDFGLNLTDEQIAGQLGAWDGVLSVGLPPEQREPFWTAMGPEVEVHLPEAKLYPGARDLLVELHAAGATLAVVTSTTREALEPSLDLHDLRALFTATVTADDVEYHKPHREPIDRALESSGAGRSGVVMIGDSVNDLGAAKNASVDSVLMHMPDHAAIYDRDELLTFDPTNECDSFSALGQLLLGQSS